MPALAPIAVADGKATPVTHTFDPVTSNGQKARLANRSASIPSGQETLEIEVREPGSKTAAYAVGITMTRPVVQTVDGQDVVVRQNKTSMTIYLAQTSSAADRKDDAIMLSNLLKHATVVDVIQNLSPLY